MTHVKRTSSNGENFTSQMDETEKQREEEEEDLLENEGGDEDRFRFSTEEFTFSDFLVKIVAGSRRTFLKQGSMFYNLQMTMCLIVFLSALVMGLSFLSVCRYERMICIFLIVQSVFGLLIVITHIIATVLSNRLGQNYRVKVLFMFTYCLIVFCIIWFILGHVWVFQKPHLTHSETSCQTAASSMGVFIIIFDYLLGVGYLFSRLWNNPLALHYLQTVIQGKIDSIPRQHVLAMSDESTSIDKQDKETIFINVNKSHIVFLFIGAILCGIPLLVVFALSTNTFDVTSTTTANHLPLQCYTYLINVDSTRVHDHQNYGSDDRSLTTGWYRFMGVAGTRLLMRQPTSINMCGGSYPGWWNGTLPTAVGHLSVGYVCFFNGNGCVDPLVSIAATNCGDFYVFHLPSISQYGYRYCTSQ